MEEQLLQSLEQSLQGEPLWAIIVAFAGGVISTLSPCVLAVIPIIMGYVGGYTEGKTSKAFMVSLLFALGLTIVLTAIGLFAALAGQVIGAFIGPYWYIILGVIAVVMGFALLDIFKIPMPALIKDMPTKNYGIILTPILLGMAFGVIATPCSTPILITIVGFVASEENIVFGALTLMAYAFGHSILPIIAGTFTGFIKQIGKLQQWSVYISKISGILLILIGLYLLGYGLYPHIAG